MNYFSKSKQKETQENYGSEFSVINSHNFSNKRASERNSSHTYTIFLYALSTISIICWFLSLSFLPFGHYFQFLLGGVVLIVNMMVFKWSKVQTST